MHRHLVLLLTAGILTGCADTTPPLAPDGDSDLVDGMGLGPPKSRNITSVSLRFTLALDIDEQGRIVGYDQSRTGTRGVLWTPATPRGTSGSITDLGSLGGAETYAFGINEEGLISGGSNNNAFIWDGVIHALNEPAGAGSSFADDVSDPSSGTRYVAGRIDFAAGPRAAVWRLSGSDLGTGPDLLTGLRADNAGQAFAANADGTVVGDAVDGNGRHQPARWTFSGSEWTISQLQLLPGAPQGQAYDVNEQGTAVGANFDPTTAACARGAVWSAGSTAATALQDLTGGFCSTAWAINNTGHITGSARDARGRHQAVLWIPQAAGGYSILALSRLGGEGRGLNEPEVDGSGTASLQVVGGPGATLWKVKLP